VQGHYAARRYFSVIFRRGLAFSMPGVTSTNYIDQAQELVRVPVARQYLRITM
jgi:hypothetical protein